MTDKECKPIFICESRQYHDISLRKHIIHWDEPYHVIRYLISKSILTDSSLQAGIK